MTKFSAINREQHATKKWRRFENYRFAALITASNIRLQMQPMPCYWVRSTTFRFAASESFVPIVAAELTKTATRVFRRLSSGRHKTIPTKGLHREGIVSIFVASYHDPIRRYPHYVGV